MLYLYSDSEGCSTCKEVYEVVSSAAVAFADRSQVSFGSFDLFRNEHMLLSELNIPVVLVYTSVEDKLRLVEL